MALHDNAEIRRIVYVCHSKEIGGADFARHYPDRGQIHESYWYKAVLHIEPKVEGVVTCLPSLSIATNGFVSVLSANSDGLRTLVSL